MAVVRSISRMRESSNTNNEFDNAEYAIRLIARKLAAVPIPSAIADVPLPAKVVTAPSGVIFLIRSLPVSAT